MSEPQLSEFALGVIDAQNRNRKSRAAGLCGCWACMEGRKEIRTIMILCPDCGNKRCPKASDHTLACTGSNEPGQPGSVYVGRKE